MKKVFLGVLMICFICFAGCSIEPEQNEKHSQVSSSVQSLTEFDTVTVPNPVPFSEKTPVLYDTYYVNNSEVEGFTFESHYSAEGQNPEYTLLFSIANNQKTELAKLTQQGAQIAFAETNDAGIFWTTTDYKVYSYLFAENKVETLPIKCMTTFSLSNDYLLFVDGDTEKLSYFDLEKYSIDVLDNVLLTNVFWLPSIYNNSVIIANQSEKGINVECHDLKTNQVSFGYEIEDKRLQNVIKTFYNDEWLVFMCAEDERNYSAFLLYKFNRKTNTVTVIDEKINLCEILLSNTLVYAIDGVVYTHDMTTQKSDIIEKLKDKSFFRVSKTTNGIISFKTNDGLEVAVLNERIVDKYR